MALSVVQICSLALSHVGISQAISSLESASNEARQCSLHYPQVRDLLLRDFAWPFAGKYRALDLVDTADGTQAWSSAWGYAYRYPVDAVRILGFVVVAGNDPIIRPFEIGNDSQGEVIYTNEADAIVAYTASITDPARFPADFADAIAWKLAARLAMPLAGRPDLRQQAEEMAKEAIALAKVSSMNERPRDNPPDADAIRARE